MSQVVMITDGSLDESTEGAQMLRDVGFGVQFVTDVPLAHGLCDSQKTIDLLKNAEAVVAWGEVYSNEILAALPKLRVIARAGVGFDHVDIQAATTHKIVVTITPTANHEAVAEHTLAMILALAKHIVPGDKAMRVGGWPLLQPTPIRGRTLGLVGLGRIGQSLAIRALSMRMHVIASDPYVDTDFTESHGIEMVDFDTLLARSDYVSLHCPLNEHTRGLMDEAQFAKMKKGAALINSSRGELVNEHEMIRSLESQHLGGAGLDVFETQPTNETNPLFKFDNVVACPHLAGNDWLAMRDMGIEAAQCIIDLASGRWPDVAVVNKELKDQWKW